MSLKRHDRRYYLNAQKLIVIGASTGGTEAVYSIVTSLTEDTPPIVIVQHMIKNFTKIYAEHLNKKCIMEVVEGEMDYN